MTEVTYKFCDINASVVDAWREEFASYEDRVQIYQGDIFEQGPVADAIVSPANSFGFMDGGIDLAYTRHFGMQMTQRLQDVIRSEYHGELLVGQAIIIPAFENHTPTEGNNWTKFNGGLPIKYLISAPTMRVPMEIKETVNPYLAFRAVILAVKEHNKKEEDAQITSILCPGLGTAVGGMPPKRCAYQMRRAFEVFELGMHKKLTCPKHLIHMHYDHEAMAEYPMLSYDK